MNEKITLYTNGELTSCPFKIEGRLRDCGRMDYAQFRNTPFCRIVRKGKRRESTYIKGFHPFMVILKGWNHPDPPDWMEDTDLLTRASKYLSHDDQYYYDFNAWFKNLNPSPDSVLLDHRWTTEVN